MQTRALLGSKGLLPNGAVKAPICSLIGHLHLHLPGLPFALLHGDMAAQSFCPRVSGSLALLQRSGRRRFALPQARPSRTLLDSPPKPVRPPGPLAPTTLPVEPSPLGRSAPNGSLPTA